MEIDVTISPHVVPGRNIWWLTIILLGCLLASGCGDGKDQVKTYSAQGKVTFQGKPMPGAQIVFHPIDGEAKTKQLLPRGIVDEDGNYNLGTYVVGDGAPAGRYKITLIWPKPPSSEIMRPDQSNDQLQSRYARVKDSTIEFTIEEKENTLPPIDLK